MVLAAINSYAAAQVPAYDTPPEKVAEFKAAAFKGDPQAQYNLAWLTALGWGGISEDKAKANELFIKSAKQGFANAQIVVAGKYHAGEFTGKYDLTEAAHWYQKAADQGSQTASAFLGFLYKEGNEATVFLKTIDKSTLEVNLLKQDSELSALYWAKAGLSKGKIESLNSLFDRASKGDWIAHGEIANLLLKDDNLKSDELRLFVAFHELKYAFHKFDDDLKNAQQGDPVAMLDVANAYNSPGYPGHPEKDTAKQLQWLKKASLSGSTEATYKLGVFYSEKGDTEDPQRAMDYFSQAAAKGHAASMCSLALIHEAKEDLVESTRWMIKAAEAGDTASWFYVGHRFQKGKGVPVNYVKAYAWFTVSSSDEKEGADTAARRRLKELAEQMTAEQIAEGQKVASQIWQELESKIAQRQRLAKPERDAKLLDLDLERMRLRGR